MFFATLELSDPSATTPVPREDNDDTGATAATCVENGGKRGGDFMKEADNDSCDTRPETAQAALTSGSTKQNKLKII